MKITVSKLREIIKEAAPRQRLHTHVRPKPSTRATKGEHLSSVKEIAPDAYRAWVNYLIEDCADKFHFLGDGRVRVVTETGDELFWDVEYSMQEWESTPPWGGESPSDDEPKSTVPGPKDPFESSRQYKQATKSKAQPKKKK